MAYSGAPRGIGDGVAAFDDGDNAFNAEGAPLRLDRHTRPVNADAEVLIVGPGGD